MNRPIKYRALDTEDRWIYGVYPAPDNWVPGTLSLDVFFDWLRVIPKSIALLDPKTLGQWTGLKDKYEDDIVLLEDTCKLVILDDGAGPEEPFNHIVPIVLQGGSFGLQITDSGEIFGKGFWPFSALEREGVDIEALQVIGNRHQNPELLEA